MRMQNGHGKAGWKGLCLMGSKGKMGALRGKSTWEGGEEMYVRRNRLNKKKENGRGKRVL